jgi:hypothetical protein
MKKLTVFFVILQIYTSDTFLLNWHELIQTQFEGATNLEVHFFIK